MNSTNSTFGTRTKGGQHGDVFTKPDVVKFMLDEVGYVSSSDLSSVSVMEPSCGEGEFVMEIVARLKLSAASFDFDLNEAYHRCVFAADIDADKVAICAERLTREFPEIIAPELNLSVEDYLLSDHQPVDIVIGNPPYIRYEEIPKEKLNQYKNFPTFFYRADMYVPFFEKSLSQLNPKGKHCFICANRWMKNLYGKKLRKLVAEHYHIAKIVNMENADAFQEEVLAYPAITLISKDKKEDSLLYADIDDVATLAHARYETLCAPDDEDWSRVFNRQTQVLSLIEEQGFKIGIGIATGADGIFISSGLKGIVEDDLLLPAVGARDLSGGSMNWSGQYFLNPYDRDGRLIRLENYPLAKAYLEGHMERLTARHKARKNPSRWYGTIDSVSPTLVNSPKVLLPDITGNSYVFVDEGKYYPQHNIYYIVGQDIRQLKMLAAILMSDFVRRQLDNLTTHMNGGYARWQSQYLRKLRIPHLNAISHELADDLLNCYEERDLAGINVCISKILSDEGEGSAQSDKVKITGRQLTFSFDYA